MINRWFFDSPHADASVDMVDLWRIDLTQFAPHLNLLWEMLSEQEQTYSARFRFEQDRRDFTLAYGVLRLLLAQALNCAPHMLCYDEVGSAQLEVVAYDSAHSVKRHMLRCSVAYTSDVAIVAFSRRHAVGVDVKAIETVPEEEAIIEGYFSARERFLLSRLPKALRTPMFFTYLARKCAFLKGQSNTQDLRLNQLDGAPAAHGWATEADVDGLLTGWRIDSLQIDADHVGALAVNNDAVLVKQHAATPEGLLQGAKVGMPDCLPAFAT